MSLSSMSSLHTGDDDGESVDEESGGSSSTQPDCHLPSLDVLRLLLPAVSASGAETKVIPNL